MLDAIKTARKEAAMYKSKIDQSQKEIQKMKDKLRENSRILTADWEWVLRMRIRTKPYITSNSRPPIIGLVAQATRCVFVLLRCRRAETRHHSGGGFGHRRMWIQFRYLFCTSEPAALRKTCLVCRKRASTEHLLRQRYYRWSDTVLFTIGGKPSEHFYHNNRSP